MRKKMMAVLLAGMMVLAAGCGKKGTVTVGQYKGLALTSVTEAEVEQELATMMAENFTSLQVVERAAEEGDTVNIYYAGTKDGVAFEGGTFDSEEGYDLELCSGNFIEGFEEGLIGAVAGEERDLNLTFPADYNNADLAGQAVVFHVTVNAVKEEVVPELTDEFIKENLEGYSTLAEYKEKCHETMNKEAYYAQITEQLMANSEVKEYNEAEVKKETQRMIEQYTTMASYYGSMYGLDTETSIMYFLGFESTEAFEEAMGTYAYDVVKNSMIIEEIAKMEKIELTSEIYDEKAVEYAKNYGYDDVKEFEETNGKEAIESSILSELVMEYIIDNAVIG